ncbi:MAG TPA: DMT family transporter [Solirubrobacteraceae bacterium]|nr:DMT family transporter [Solirubrobacteraceae bacterium]
MLAILGGLGAAAAWAVSILCSSRSSRLIDPMAVVAWLMLVGLVITAPLAAVTGVPARLHGSALAWLILSGAGNVGGLILNYYALRIGQVSLVAPIVSTEGAIAAVISVIAGASLAASVAVALFVIVIGVVLAALPSRDAAVEDAAHHPAVVLFAALATLSFGTSLYATGRAAALLPASWVVLSARLIGAFALALPLALSGRLRLTVRAVPFLLASGIAEVVGFYSYTWGSRHGLAIAAVLSSQFAVIALTVSYVLFGERLSRTQLAGVVTVLAGVAALSVLRA